MITDYTYGLDTLDRYDYQQLEVAATTAEEPFHATYENAMAALQVLREKFGGSELFAHEKDESFKSTMGAIYQTFGGWARLLDNNTLVALTLMIAESRTEEKDEMTKVVVNLINKNN